MTTSGTPTIAEMLQPLLAQARDDAELIAKGEKPWPIKPHKTPEMTALMGLLELFPPFRFPDTAEGFAAYRGATAALVPIFNAGCSRRVRPAVEIDEAIQTGRKSWWVEAVGCDIAATSPVIVYLHG